MITVKNGGKAFEVLIIKRCTDRCKFLATAKQYRLWIRHLL